MTRRWKDFVDMLTAVQTQQPAADKTPPPAAKHHHHHHHHHDDDDADSPSAPAGRVHHAQAHTSHEHHHSKPRKPLPSAGLETDRSRKKDERTKEAPSSRHQGNPGQKNAAHNAGQNQKKNVKERDAVSHNPRIASSQSESSTSSRDNKNTATSNVQASDSQTKLSVAQKPTRSTVIHRHSTLRVNIIAF